jgi:hypothetical protein
METRKAIANNIPVISKAIWKLFTILSTWKTNGNWSNRGLTLELSVDKPCDPGHSFKDYDFKTDVNKDGPSGSHRSHDPSCDWVNNWHMGSMRLFNIVRTMHSPSDVSFEQKLPEVGIVTSFLLRRRTCCQLTPRTLSQILVSLTGLEHINYEVWRDLSRSRQKLTDIGISYQTLGS